MTENLSKNQKNLDIGATEDLSEIAQLLCKLHKQLAAVIPAHPYWKVSTRISRLSCLVQFMVLTTGYSACPARSTPNQGGALRAALLKNLRD